MTELLSTGSPHLDNLKTIVNSLCGFLGFHTADIYYARSLKALCWNRNTYIQYLFPSNRRHHIVTSNNEAGIMRSGALPEENPTITGVEMQYHIGDEINLNCTSGKSHPASILHWYINEQQIQTPEALIEYPPYHHPKGLVSSTLGLRFKLSNHHFRGGSMRVKCVASIAPILYRSDRESVVQTQSLPIKDMREALLLVKSSTSRICTDIIPLLLISILLIT